MITLLSPFQNLIESLPTTWVDLIDRPQPLPPSTSEAITFSLTPARMVLAALERFTQSEPETTEPEPRYTPETLPDYWAIATQSGPEPIAIARNPVTLKTQLCLPAARTEEKTYPTIQERYEAKKKRDAERWGNKQAIATPTMQPDGETPNLSDYFRVTGATGQFNVKHHGEGFVVVRWKKTKRNGWEQTTHLISQHGCDCAQAQKKPGSVCCHLKAVKSFELSEKNRLQKEEWDRQSNEKSAKVKAELDAIAAQRQQDKLNQLIREEAQQKEAQQAKENLGLAPHIVPKGDRTKLLVECRDLFLTCAFNESTGMEFLVKRYDKAKLDAFTDAELEDLADYMSANRYQLKKANLKDNHLAKSGLKTGDICKAKKTGFNYRIKQLNDDGMAKLQTLIGNFEVILPIDRLEAI